ncbi:MAG TPA: RimK/LysX family protein [Polyangia bacterium]|jgi:predicted deacylase|nr:RimK/LysX family protein [Polyangia bacterium]
MLQEPPARGIRVGGVIISPGETRTVSIPLVHRPLTASANPAGVETGARDPIPVWAAVGNRAGPRVSVVAATRGFEATAAMAASELAGSIDVAAIAGSLLVVPVLRPGGQFSPGGRPRGAWRFPGDAAGTRHARNAFTLFSEIVVGAQVVIVLGSPPPGRRGALTVRGELDEPRTRRLALQSGAVAALSVKGAAGSLLAAAQQAGVVAIELRAAGAPGSEAAEAEELLAALRAVLIAAAVFLPETPEQTLAPVAPPLPAVLDKAIAIRAAAGGLVEISVTPGQFVRKATVLGRVIPPLGGKPVEITAPRDGLILESTIRAVERPQAKLFVLGPLSRSAARRLDVTAAKAAEAAGDKAKAARAKRAANRTLHVGWVENVALPNLGIMRLKAKIDTGARTSALHVARMKTVDTAGGPQRRPILEIVVPSGPRGSKSLKVRAAVREYVVVRDTSGRMERRPVIETTLQLGRLKKRIAVTLTNRGDMLFPMLIGRTALGPGIIVDPSRRYLVQR